MTKVSLKDLLEAGCHFGHQARRWHPKMEPYLYMVRDGVHVFDLAKTKEGLEAAAKFAKDVVLKGGEVVFVGTKRQARAIIVEEAKKAGAPYVSQRWLGGAITNWEQIKKRIDKLLDMKDKRKKGEYKKYTKKEQILLDREIVRLERFFGGLVSLENIPEAIFVVDIKKEEAAVKEARRKDVKVIAVVDSNTNPEMVDYVIPANDDAVGAVKLIVATVAEAVKEGKEALSKKGVKKAKVVKKEKKDDQEN